MQYHAKPGHWDYVDKRKDLPSCSCILELHHRLEALESRDCIEAPVAPPPAAPGGLVERVAEAMGPRSEHAMERGELPHGEARAAVLAVAAWLEGQKVGAGVAAARWIRQEVE